ncbi:DNA topoisomerase IB [soil metagenome]
MTTENEDILKDAKLRFSTDQKPGYSRSISNEHFVYYNTEGTKITDEVVISRINKLVIPPAYKKVWICPYANGYLQATGYDARKRKQYRYHPLWTQAMHEEKFSHLLSFAHQLPKIRRHVTHDMKLTGMPKEKILATIVWLLENTLIRIGNEEYEKENKSYGLTTLKNKHVTFAKRNNVLFEFKGKSDVYHSVSIHSKKVAAIIRKCRELPGQELFEYRNEEGEIKNITSYDVNEYLKGITGTDTTAKDFRTWGGTVMAASQFDTVGIGESADHAKKNIVATVKKVSGHLRNRPATCKKYYIHPSIIGAYQNGKIISHITSKLKKKTYKPIRGLDIYENQVVALLGEMEKENEIV